MSVDMVKQIVEEITSASFRKKHEPIVCRCSENGEMLMNPEILDILRLLKGTGLFVDGYSNLSLLTGEHIKAICDEELLEAVHVNIDGIGPAYKEVKGLNYERTEANLQALVNYRAERMKPVIFVHIITMESYVRSVNRFYGRDPMKYRGQEIAPGEHLRVMGRIGKIIRQWDRMGVDDILLWAERKGPRRPGTYTCPLLARIKTSAFINPAGDWYGCCFDAGNENVLGSIRTHSIDEIAEGKVRKQFIEFLQEGRLNEIGGPCLRADACQVIPHQLG